MARPSLRVIAGDLASTIVNDTVAVAEAAIDLVLPEDGNTANEDLAQPMKKVPRLNNVPRVAVIGGGVAGMSAALQLAQQGKKGVKVTLFEATSELGGKVKLHTVAGHELDAGAESMIVARPEAIELVKSVGLGRDLVEPETTKASIWRRGKLRPIPKGLVGGVPTDLQALAASELMSLQGLMRLPLDHVLNQTVIEDDVSIGDYVGARLGREAVDALIDPLIGGVYAGWPDDLSFEMTMPALFRLARQERSLLQAAQDAKNASESQSGDPDLPLFMGLKGGIGRLVAATRTKLESKNVKIRTEAVVTGLRPYESGWRLAVSAGNKVERHNFDAVILALPAPGAARLLRKPNTPASSILDGINYASVGLVTLVYDRKYVPKGLTGSGLLVPSEAGMGTKAATFVSNKWGWVDSEEDFIVRASMGRFGQSDLLQVDDTELVNLAGDELNSMTGLPTEVKAANITRWGGALPQYAVGHRGRMAKVRELLVDTPGIAVCGAAYDGVGLSACISSANIAAGQIATYVKQQKELARV